MTGERLAALHLWRVPRRAVPAALLRMAADRPALRHTPGLLFAKLLGTGSGRTFTPGDADPRRWALLTVWNDAGAADAFEIGGVPGRWRRIAAEEWSVRLRPLAARGRWSGREPFGRPAGPGQRWDGAVAAITRARLTPRKAVTFWRAVPPVSADLHVAPGLRLALGIGEAPIGLQGTFSLWGSAAALNSFAYDRAPHAEVVRRTPVEGWYAEELFARFGVLSATGTVDGRDPLAADDAVDDATGGWDPATPGVLRLPSGRLVRGRALSRPLPPGPPPQFAVHLLGRPPSPVPWAATWVRWPDFRSPADPQVARAVLTAAWRRSATERVEVACAGGQGRTGTALACLAVLDGVPPEDAVGYVRAHYSPRAVETSGQERFVREFAAARREA